VKKERVKVILRDALITPGVSPEYINKQIDRVVVEDEYFVPRVQYNGVPDDRETNMTDYGFKRAFKYQDGIHIYWFYTNDNPGENPGWYVPRSQINTNTVVGRPYKNLIEQ